MDKIMKSKRGLELLTSRTSVYQNKVQKILLLVMYITWPSLMMQCKAVFELFQKLDIDIINYSTLICPFESGKCLGV